MARTLLLAGLLVTALLVAPVVAADSGDAPTAACIPLTPDCDAPNPNPCGRLVDYDCYGPGWCDYYAAGWCIHN